MNKKLSNTSRLLLLIACAALIFVLFTPIWRIELSAPQYPEGLSLTIYANGLKGNIDIINGLNHYIGMKTLHNEDFVEFTMLPYIIIFFVLAFAFVAILKRKTWLNILLGLFVIFGIGAMVDFWQWEYNYGHNLNPNAAIIVPGMAYQPPLIGYKQLLNFGAYSIPATGGWIFISTGILLLVCVIIEWKSYRVNKKHFAATKAVLVTISLFVLLGCQSGPQAIKSGKDNCSFCKMTFTDPKYGAELVTQKGKVYKFDDIHCIQSFLTSKIADVTGANDIYLVDFAGSHSLVKVSECFLLQGGEIRGPMDGNVIAFKETDSLKIMAVKMKAVPVSWEQINK